MKKLLLLITTFFFLTMGACQQSDSLKSTHFTGYFKVTGDVSETLLVNSESTYWSFDNLVRDDQEWVSFTLDQLFDFYDSSSEDFDVLIISHDGLMNQIQNHYDYVTLYLNENGWNIHAPDFPPTLRLRGVTEIVLVEKSPDLSASVNMITSNENLASFTPGSMRLMSLLNKPVLDGQSSRNEFEMFAFRNRLLYPITHYQDMIEEVLIMTRDGGFDRTTLGYLEVKDHQINYYHPDSRRNYLDIVGLILNPPKRSIMDAYHDSITSLDQNIPVMVIFIDGYSYDQFLTASSKEFIPFMTSLGLPDKAVSVYPPVTNSGMAALLTGEPPNVNGILSRRYREPQVPTIFDYVNERNGSSVLITGNTSILDVATQVVLNLDRNDSGCNDDEVFESALLHLEGQDYIMVHFKGLDKLGHTYGEINAHTLEKLEELDDYVKQLVSAWEGTVIITSDHGMHTTEEGGYHGDFRYEDLIVPYWLIKGGFFQ